jgi:hypothetical protein
VSRGYAVANVLLAGLWLGLYFGFVPSRSRSLDVTFLAASLLFAAGAVGWWRGGRWGRRIALMGAVAAAAFALLLVTGLVAAAAYLHGIFGAMGQAASAVAVFGAIVVAALMGLLPAVEIARLWRRS